MKRSQILRDKTATSRAKRPKTREFPTTVLEREEWFFGKVPEDEIITCFYYEYARSRKDIRELVHSWREKLADLEKAYDVANAWKARIARGGWWDHTFKDVNTATNAFRSDLRQLTDSTCSQLLINLPEFPSTPWQKIRPTKRGEWKRLLTFYSYLDSIRGGLRPESIDKVVIAIRTRNMVTRFGEIGPFFIDWNGCIEKVISDFEKWARKHYSELNRKKKPRDTYYESLKQLGVMRLKDSLGSWKPIQDYTRKVLGYKLYEDDHALWRKARLVAIKRISEMFPITRAH